jgi:hypothetical protein
MRNLGDRAVVNAEQLQCALDSLLRNKSVRWLSNRDFECLHKVTGAQSCNRCEFNEPELVFAIAPLAGLPGRSGSWGGGSPHAARAGIRS